MFLPFQLVLVSPFLAPVWLCGLWRLLRDPRLRPWRFLGVAYLVLLLVFLATGAEPYYLAGLFPVLLAAGAGPVLAWARGRRRGPVLVGGALAASLVVASVLFLPAVPEEALARYTPDVPVYSGHNALWSAGPPPESVRTRRLDRWAEIWPQVRRLG